MYCTVSINYYCDHAFLHQSVHFALKNSGIDIFMQEYSYTKLEIDS